MSPPVSNTAQDDHFFKYVGTSLFGEAKKPRGGMKCFNQARLGMPLQPHKDNFYLFRRPPLKTFSAKAAADSTKVGAGSGS